MISLSDLSLASRGSDQSDAIALEHASSISLNIKEVALETLRQGGTAGFVDYDSRHETQNCVHCPDAFCSLIPKAPNQCDVLLCSRCFREPDARKAAITEAEKQFLSLNVHNFDRECQVAMGGLQVEALTKLAPLAKNGYAFGAMRLDDDLAIHISCIDAGVRVSTDLPRGLVIE